MYYNYPMNPYYRQQQSPQLIRVNGIQSVKSRTLSPNSVQAMFDTQQDIFYIKSTDGAGFATIRTFDFTERKQNEQTTDYVTRNEYNDLIKEITDLKEMFNNGKQSRQKVKLPEQIIDRQV